MIFDEPTQKRHKYSPFLVFFRGRCYRRPRHAVRIHVAIMTRQSLATRVGALEEKVGNKTIEEQFRDQAELIDRRLDESFRSQAELIDRLFLERNRQWDVRFSGLEKDVSALKKDMTIV